MAKEVSIKPEWAHEILRAMLPPIIIEHNLFNMFIRNPDKASKRLQMILPKLKNDYFHNKYIITHSFESDKKLLIKLIKKSDFEIMDFGDMYLMKAVAIFESMINEYFQNEIMRKFKTVSLKQVNHLLFSLPIEKKLRWLLLFLCNKDFTKSAYWVILKNTIQARNFFIHYKPETWKKQENYMDYITRKHILSFLKSAGYCHKYLQKYASQEQNEYELKVEKIQTITDARFAQSQEIYKKYKKKFNEMQKEIDAMKSEASE